MRNINIADAWQITFYRVLAFIFSIMVILFYKNRFFPDAKLSYVENLLKKNNTTPKHYTPTLETLPHRQQHNTTNNMLLC